MNTCFLFLILQIKLQAFLTTQYNDKDESNELTSLRGARAKSQKLYGK